MVKQGQKGKTLPEQGQLPLDIPEEERYDPGPRLGSEVAGEGKRKKDGASQGHSKKAARVSEVSGQLPFPEPDIQARRGTSPESLGSTAESKGKKTAPALASAANDDDPFVDQFCEQVARMIARGNPSRQGDAATGGKHESSQLSKGQH